MSKLRDDEPNYDEAMRLFLWLGFQLSDDNDCHRFQSGPVAYITAKLDAAEARGRAAGLEEAINHLEALRIRLRGDAEAFRFRGLLTVCDAKRDAAYGYKRAIDEVRTLIASTSKLSTTAQTITLTITGSTPAANTGRVRITMYYVLPTAPTS